MRIAFVSYEYPSETVTGGIGTYTVQMSALLAAHGFEVHVFGGSHIRSSVSSENGVTIHRVACTGPEDFQENVVPVFEAEHRKSNFQLIESPEIHANGRAIKNKFPELPLLVRLHASNYLVEHFKKKYIPLKNKLRYFLGALKKGKWDLGYWRKYDYKNDRDYLFTQKADHISAPSEVMKRYAEKNWHMPPGKIAVIKNPFRENSLFKSARTDNSEKTIIFYGRLNVLKGLITATKAMKNILQNNGDWNWLVIGEDGTGADGRSSMKAWMIKELEDVAGKVSFINTVAHEEIPGLLKKASVVLIPGLFESYSYVTIEAMSAGKAIVGSSGTAVASLVEHNISGKLANPYRVQDWTKAIQELIENVAMRKKIGAAAFGKAEQLNGSNDEIIKFYQSLVS